MQWGQGSGWWGVGAAGGALLGAGRGDTVVPQPYLLHRCRAVDRICAGARCCVLRVRQMPGILGMRADPLSVVTLVLDQFLY